MKMKMNMDLTGQTMDMNMSMLGNVDFEVKANSPAEKELSMEYTRMKMSVDIKMPGMPSNSINDENLGNKLIGKKVVLKLNDKNEITETTGFDEIISDSNTDPQTRKQMEQLFSKEQINSMFGAMFQLYPDKPVKVGDTWQRETELTIAGMTMMMQMEYKLVNVKNGIASINMDGKLKGKGKMSQQGIDMEMEIKGGQKGNINIGLEDGYQRDSKFTMDMSGTIDVIGKKVPMTMKSDYEMKGSKP